MTHFISQSFVVRPSHNRQFPQYTSTPVYKQWLKIQLFLTKKSRMHSFEVILLLWHTYTIIMSDGLQIDLENWMSQLPESIKNTPFIYLAIPGLFFNMIYITIFNPSLTNTFSIGSHDSMTFNINRDSTLAPDAPSIVRRLWPLFKGTIVRWSKTQQINVHQQLFSGIRCIIIFFC